MTRIVLVAILLLLPLLCLAQQSGVYRDKYGNTVRTWSDNGNPSGPIGILMATRRERVIEMVTVVEIIGIEKGIMWDREMEPEEADRRKSNEKIGFVAVFMCNVCRERPC